MYQQVLSENRKSLTQFSIILDLDETLIKSWENPQWLPSLEIYSNIDNYKKFCPQSGVQQFQDKPIIYSIYSGTRNNGRETKLWGIERPYLREFIDFTHDYFKHIIVWSAGLSFYVEDLCRHIFKKCGHPCPKMIWSRENCEKAKHYLHKPINKISKQSNLNIDLSKTFIVDDKEFTFSDNPHNGILIPQYNPGLGNLNNIPTLDNLLDRKDDHLLRLMNWFSKPEVMSALDVRTLDKSYIFNEPYTNQYI